MKKVIMTAAHQIRKAAAQKWGGKAGDYSLSIALQMAHEAAKGVKSMIAIKQDQVNKYRVVEGKEQVEEIIMNADVRIWEKGDNRRAYLGTGKDKSYYDLNTGIFYLESRGYKHHISNLIPEFNEIS